MIWFESKTDRRRRREVPDHDDGDVGLEERRGRAGVDDLHAPAVRAARSRTSVPSAVARHRAAVDEALEPERRRSRAERGARGPGRRCRSSRASSAAPCRAARPTAAASSTHTTSEPAARAHGSWCARAATRLERRRRRRSPPPRPHRAADAAYAARTAERRPRTRRRCSSSDALGDDARGARLRARRPRLRPRARRSGSGGGPSRRTRTTSRRSSAAASTASSRARRSGSPSEERLGLVQPVPPLHRVVDDRHVERGRGARAPRSVARGRAGPPARDACARYPMNRMSSSAVDVSLRVPGPPDAPHRAPPQHPGREREREEDDADLDGRRGEQVPPLGARPGPQVQRRGQRGETERAGRARPRQGRGAGTGAGRGCAGARRAA